MLWIDSYVLDLEGEAAYCVDVYTHAIKESFSTTLPHFSDPTLPFHLLFIPFLSFPFNCAFCSNFQSNLTNHMAKQIRSKYCAATMGRLLSCWACSTPVGNLSRVSPSSLTFLPDFVFWLLVIFRGFFFFCFPFVWGFDFLLLTFFSLDFVFGFGSLTGVIWIFFFFF